MIIYLEEYRKAKARKAALRTNYQDELLCVNWNPAVAVTPGAVTRSSPPAWVDTPDIYADMDMTEFMVYTYALATQI